MMVSAIRSDMKGWGGSWVAQATFLTAVWNHGWGPLGDTVVIAATTYIITLLVLAFRAGRDLDGIKIKTPFFTIIKKPTRRPKGPKDAESISE
jgi:hypothetical protein